MRPFIGKVVAEIGRTLGRAVIAGIGMEIAKVAGSHLQKRLAAKDKAAPAGQGAEPEGGASDVEQVRAENDRLRAEVERLREELEARRRR